MPLTVINPAVPFQQEYQRIIKELVQAFEGELKGNLHSIYLYGSVARKCAVPGTSNIDLVVVTHRPTNERFKTLLSTIKWRFKKAYPFVTELSMRFPLATEVLDIENVITWGFMLKHCCVCIYGDDLATRYGDFEPSWEIGKFWNMDVSDWVSHYRKKIAQTTNKEELIKHQITIAKKLLRASYSLIMHKDKGWYDNPSECGARFLKYYPEKQLEIERLNILLSGRDIPKRSVIGLLDDFGSWLADAYQKTEFKIG